jgi:hypothetical protein
LLLLKPGVPGAVAAVEENRVQLRSLAVVLAVVVARTLRDNFLPLI